MRAHRDPDLALVPGSDTIVLTPCLWRATVSQTNARNASREQAGLFFTRVFAGVWGEAADFPHTHAVFYFGRSYEKGIRSSDSVTLNISHRILS